MPTSYRRGLPPRRTPLPTARIMRQAIPASRHRRSQVWSVQAPRVAPPLVSVITQIGATWTDTRPSSTMDSTIAVHKAQAQHIQSFGAPDNLAPTPGNPNVLNTAALSPFVVDMIDAGATKPMIILCRATGWMKPSGVNGDDTSITPANRTNFATLCANIVAYFDGSSAARPLVQYYSFWNEMKNYHIPHRTAEAAAFATYEANYGTAQPPGTIGNHWDYVRYTADYNAAWTACKAVRNTIKFGGPYVILQSGATGSSWSHGPSALTFPGGSHDQRQIDVMNYFVANATGYDFLSCDGGIGNNRAGAVMPVNPTLQIEKLWGWWQFVRTLGGNAASCELINFETYVQEALDPPWSFNIGETEDLLIELARKTKQNVSNGGLVIYNTWFHPLYRPQVVNNDGNNPSFAWSAPNTASGLGAKITTWHTNGT